MRSIAQIVKHFKQNWIEELSDDSIAQACRDAGMSWLDSMLNPIVTVQIFLIQILHGNTACQHMPRLCEMTFTAAGYCKARMRVKLEVFELLLSRCVDSIQQQTLDAGRWLGHRVFIVDGSSFSMPDTIALQNHFGQHTAQKPGCGFPTAHWLAMLHMGTGMITKMLASPLRTHDMARTAELHPELQAGDLLVADRAFCSFAHLCLLIERRVEAVLRVHQRTIVDFTPRRPHTNPNRTKVIKGLPRSRWLRRLGINDQVVVWFKNRNNRPNWMSKEQYASLPNEITVRELRYTVNQKGFRAKEITLVTTLLDHEVYSLEELADLFRRRWEIETHFGHIKTTMAMDVLKCQTVEGVLKELHVFALIYNLVRQVIVVAAANQNVAVARISFIDALRWLQSAKLGNESVKLVVNPHRPNRYEPRVKKRRPKTYTFMTKPRNQLKKDLAQK